MSNTHYVQRLIQEQVYPSQTLEEIQRLEAFILYGVKSFHPTTSFVIQGRGINSLIKIHFDHYVELMREILGEGAAIQTLRNKNHHLGRSLAEKLKS